MNLLSLANDRLYMHFKSREEDNLAMALREVRGAQCTHA